VSHAVTYMVKLFIISIHLLCKARGYYSCSVSLCFIIS